jgi:hypothetical protein
MMGAWDAPIDRERMNQQAYMQDLIDQFNAQTGQKAGKDAFAKAGIAYPTDDEIVKGRKQKEIQAQRREASILAPAEFIPDWTP